ncbi:ovomucoid-like [Lutzomyia longipalpis]|uniref:ovomucoid-like n=1 Tax=Lutzomyia longipalpis TaxID=7200 RepID=UPI0024840984|nr:ovomucoid-like [Lutzomyia longipalpis]
MKVFLCFVTVFIAVSYGQAEEEAAVACTAQMCTALYDPVCCTYSDGTKKTFSNACAANNDRCQTGKTWDSQTKGECEAACDKACIEIYSPVCCTYSDGTKKTYGNSCAADVETCRLSTKCETVTEGECQAEPAEPECNSICTAIYAPVCCTYEDGTQKTYSSDCACEADNCAKKTTCAKKT